MNALRFRLRVFLTVFLVVMLIGVVGFSVAEQVPVGDAFYFTIVTVTTVGYGDLTPKTPSGKVLAIFLIVMGVGTFLGVIGNAVELMLARREHSSRMEKLNMVIGAFFSELGTALLALFAKAHPKAAALRERFIVDSEWSAADFAAVRAQARTHDYSLNPDLVDLDELTTLLQGKREFLLRLLENPVLLEHEHFTGILWAVFHLTEELSCRPDKTGLPDADRQHLAGDMKRAYSLLTLQWIDYIKHLKARYPYLFSLAVRTNPFDEESSPIIQ